MTITANWTSEFRGFFLADGCADIQRYKRGRGKQFFYRPRIRISLRIDDLELLEEIQSKLGGNLRKRTSKKSNPSVTWEVNNKQQIVVICEMMLQGSVLPAKKLKDIEIVRDAAILRAGKLGHISDGERIRLEELYQASRDAKRFD